MLIESNKTFNKALSDDLNNKVFLGLNQIMSAKLILGPTIPNCITCLVEILCNGKDTIALFYISNPKTFFALLFFIAFFLYYLCTVVAKPEFFCRDGKFRWFLLANCTQLHERYWPPIWCYGTHVQTALANYLRGRLPELSYKRQYILLPDGGQVSLDWYDPGVKSETTIKNSLSTSSSTYENKPIALFLPGLIGHSQSEYIKSLVPIAYELGYRPVVLNNRGTGNMKLLTAKSICATNHDDLQHILDLIKTHDPTRQIIAVGISLGGIVLARYLIHTGDKSIVHAAMLISVCWDMSALHESLQRPSLNVLLDRHLTRYICHCYVRENRQILQESQNINVEDVLESKTLKELDERFTIKLWGFKTVKDYYTESSHIGKLCYIKRPTLCLNAADDMFAPYHALPVDEVQQTSHVAMVVTLKGGHIGFMDGLLPRLPFYTERLLQQYLSSLIKLESITNELL